MQTWRENSANAKKYEKPTSHALQYLYRFTFYNSTARFSKNLIMIIKSSQFITNSPDLRHKFVITSLHKFVIRFFEKRV